MRAVSLTEVSCGFSCTDDLKIDLFDHLLVGTAKRYNQIG